MTLRPRRTPFVLMALAGLISLRPPLRASETVSSAASRQDPLAQTADPARGVAMGRAFAAMSDAPEGFFWNPAALSGHTRSDLSFHHARWMETSRDTLATTASLKGAGAFGLAASYVDFGSIEGRAGDGSLLGDYSANELQVRTAWGRSLIPDIGVGVGFQATQSSLAQKSYSNLQTSWGILARPSPLWRIGACYDGVPVDRKSAQGSSSFRLGAARTGGDNARWSWTLAGGTDLEIRSSQALEFGAEGAWAKTAFVRAGCRQVWGGVGSPDTEWSLGVGVGVAGLRLDYAYLPGTEVGGAHHFSLGRRFGPQAMVPPTQVGKHAPSNPAPEGPGKVGAAMAEIPGVEWKPLQLEFDLPSDDLEQARSFQQEDNELEAEKAFRRAVRKNPGDAEAWWEMGNYYYRASRKAEAVRCFEKILKLRPENESLSKWLGIYREEPAGGPVSQGGKP